MPATCRCIVLFLLLLFCYAFINQGYGWNQNARLNLLHAIVLERTLAIDAYHENTRDKAFFARHYYSDKAPGIAFLALPAFAASAFALDLLEIPPDSPAGWAASTWITTALSVGLIAALGGIAFFVMLASFVSPRRALIATLAIFLGSLPFPYATVLFSHAATIGLLSIALRAALHRRWMVAGLASGFAVASEYPALLALPGIAALAFSSGRRDIRNFVVGALPGLLLIPLYSHAIYGSPFVLSYAHTTFEGMWQGFYGFSLIPHASNIIALLISPAKGLFFWTPFFLLSFAGYPLLKRTSRALFLVTLIVPVAILLAIGSYFAPLGGESLGARHLAPLVPFLAIPAAFGLQRFPRAGALLAVLSVLLTGTATLIDAFPPEGMLNPVLEYYVPKLFAGDFMLNLSFLVGWWPGWRGVLLFGATVCALIAFLYNRCDGTDLPRFGPAPLRPPLRSGLRGADR